MFLLFLVGLLGENTFSDIRGYTQGLGILHMFPDIYPSTSYYIQGAISNFYGINGTFLFSLSYNKPNISVGTSLLNLISYYRSATITIAIRHVMQNVYTKGVAITFQREIIPMSVNRISFAFSTGIHLFKKLRIHASVYDIPVRTRIPLFINISTTIGRTGIVIEGEKGLPLKLLLFQNFKISNRVKILLSFSTAPNNLGIGIIIRHKNIYFEPFTKIHDVLGQSSGLIVEYAPSQSYN